MFCALLEVENQRSVTTFNKVLVQPLNNLLIQYEAPKYLGFRLIALTPPSRYVLHSNEVENQWSVTPFNRLQVQTLCNLLIQYEALKYLGFGLTPTISACFAL